MNAISAKVTELLASPMTALLIGLLVGLLVGLWIGKLIGARLARKAQSQAVVSQLGKSLSRSRQENELLRKQIRVHLHDAVDKQNIKDLENRIAWVLLTVNWPDNLEDWLEDPALLNQLEALNALAQEAPQIQHLINDRSIAGLLKAYQALHRAP